MKQLRELYAQTFFTFRTKGYAIAMIFWSCTFRILSLSI